MRNFEMCRRAAKSASGAKMTLIYSITVDELTNPVNGAELEDYGACVRVSESGESACVRHITPVSSKIFALTGLLSENTVTPTTLRDIVCDWLNRA